ncbi:MAG: hypothetical protein ACPG77_20685, partial [Nannocystaceae bacterium]
GAVAEVVSIADRPGEHHSFSAMAFGTDITVDSGVVTQTVDGLESTLDTTDTDFEISLPFLDPADDGEVGRFRVVELEMEVSTPGAAPTDGSYVECRLAKADSSSYFAFGLIRDAGVWKTHGTRGPTRSPVLQSVTPSGPCRTRAEASRTNSSYRAVVVSTDTDLDGDHDPAVVSSTSHFGQENLTVAEEWSIKLVGHHAGGGEVEVVLRSIAWQMEAFR